MRTKIELDLTDASILRALIKDARTNVTEMAHKLKITPTAVAKRIDHLKSKGVIVGTEIRLDLGALGYSHAATVLISAEISKLDKVAKKVRSHPNVVVCAKSIGKFNMCSVVMAKSIAELDKATNAIRHIEGVNQANINIWVEAMFLPENIIDRLESRLNG